MHTGSRGIPNELAKEGCPAKIPVDLLPDGSVAADLWSAGNGIHVEKGIHFGWDPFPLKRPNNGLKLRVVYDVF
ncbi:hypothetical protein FQN60_000145, partial [Etheostoma spectabile]